VASSPAVSILVLLQRAAVPIHTICGGRAQCGRCLIQVLEGSERMNHPGPAELLRLKAPDCRPRLSAGLPELHPRGPAHPDREPFRIVDLLVLYPTLPHAREFPGAVPRNPGSRPGGRHPPGLLGPHGADPLRPTVWAAVAAGAAASVLIAWLFQRLAGGVRRQGGADFRGLVMLAGPRCSHAHRLDGRKARHAVKLEHGVERHLAPGGQATGSGCSCWCSCPWCGKAWRA